MGKVKGQRTKGNTRPSNSLRSAQLLSSTLGGAPINTFIGFDALKDVNSSEILTNSAAGSSLLTKDDEDVDPDFKLTIKQMYKKDSITKIKALQKFADYCNEKEYEVVKTVLSMWPRVFNRLAIVNDFKVREATFLAQEALAKKLGKNIAPILKQIIAIWVISLHDTYPVAASAAKLSFSTSFSPAKQSEVLSFCKDEIVNYCKDIILVQTITSIDDPSNASHEDRESKYNRLVSCSLQSLCLLINSLTQPEIIEESITSFVQHDKFWKLEKYDDINVKVNWYRFKSVVCEKYPQIAIKNEAKFTSSTLLHIAEKDPLLSAAIWENVLWVLVTIDEWWKHININKGFLPHLRKMLREGSYGNASSIFPNLLPMLSKFPFKSIENPAKFCEDFIEAFEICILNPNHTGKEYACIVKSYFECLQYLLIEKNSLFTSESTEKLVATVCERVSTCTDNMLKDWHDIYGLFFSELTFFIASLKDPELITNLTSIVEIKLLKIIDDAVNDVQKLGLLTKLLSALLRINQDKSYRRVKFDEDESSESIVPEEKPKSKAIIFRNTLCKIWDRLLDLTSQKETQTPWLYCLKIVQELCILVSKESGCKFPVDNYLDNLKYLLKSQTNFTVPSTRSANYKHIINMLINSCDSSTKKNEILRYLSLCDDNLILINLFELMQSRIEKDDFLKDWFTTPEVAPLIVNSCNKILNYSDDDTQISISDIKANAEFIKFSFKINDIHHPTINEIASMLSQSLTNPTSDDQLLIVGSIIKALFDQYLYSSQLDSSVSLILKVTQSCLYMNTSGEALQLLKSILTSGLNKLIDNDEETNRDQLLYGIASILRQSIMIKENSFAMAERTSTIAALFMNTVQKKIVETESFNFLVNLLENILPEDTFWIQRISEIGYKAFFPFWINGQVIISKGLKFSTNHINHDQSLIYSIYSIITILESLVKSASITKKIVDVQLPFICFTLEYLESMPKSINFQERETILQSLSNYLKKIVGSMTRNEAIPFVKKLILSEPHPAIALILGLKPLLCYCKKLSPIDSEWKLETFNPESISVFQSINQYFDSDEIIQLAQDSLKYFLCMEDASSVRQSYGRLAVMNTILSGNVKIPTLDLIDPLMEHMIGLKEKNEDLLLLECSLDNRPEEDILFAIEVINIFQTIISKFHKDLSLGQKDLIIISVTAWSISLSNSDAKSYENPVKMVFFCRFFQLLLSIHHKMEAEGDNFASLREWTDFHLLRISSSLVPLLFKLNGLSFTGYQLDYVFLLGKCISSLPIVDVAGLEKELNQFKFDEKPAHVEKAVIFSLPKEYESLFTQLNHLLVNKYPSFYLSSHNLIQKLIPMMVSSSNVIESSDDYLAPPKPFLSKLQETNVIVNTLLSEYSLGTTCCLINIGTDAFCYTTAYLLNWLQILNLFSQLNDENRSSLAGYLTESGYIFHLLDNLFKLMPVHPDDQISSDTNFIQDVLMKNNLEAQDESVHIQSLSCLVYFHLLRKMPACVRMWLSKLDKRISDLVNRFTTSTMSELICGEEFRAIQNADSDKFKNIKVKARHGAREVVAVYEIEDMSIELTIKLAENHPLTPVTIDGGKRVGVSVPEWRNWLLQVTSFLTHQNGTVLDGLILWNKNMCKRFEGLEECVICYFILHGSNCQVPKLTCRNCKKKFHSACLYKWFEKSNQSSCPLCRNPFTFSKQQFTPTTANPQQPYQRQHL